jgi:hypothetical protein
LSCLDLAALFWCNSARLSETWFSNKWLWANWNSVEKNRYSVAQMNHCQRKFRR